MDLAACLFLRVVVEDVFSEVVVFVSLGTVADGLLHALFDAVNVVEQALLCFFAGIGALVDDVDDVLDLLAAFPDGVVQRLPLPHLPMLGRELAARDEEAQGCQRY